MFLQDRPVKNGFPCFQKISCRKNIIKPNGAMNLTLTTYIYTYIHARKFITQKDNTHTRGMVFRSSENPRGDVRLKAGRRTDGLREGRIKDSRVVSQFSFERPWGWSESPSGHIRWRHAVRQ
jgi:hypothetical protein